MKNKIILINAYIRQGGGGTMLESQPIKFAVCQISIKIAIAENSIKCIRISKICCCTIIASD